MLYIKCFFLNAFLNADNFCITDPPKINPLRNLPACESLLDLNLCLPEVTSGKKFAKKVSAIFPLPSTQIQNLDALLA